MSQQRFFTFPMTTLQSIDTLPIKRIFVDGSGSGSFEVPAMSIITDLLSSTYGLFMGAAVLPGLAPVIIPDVIPLASGNNALFTCPVNSRAFISISLFNTAGTTTTVFGIISKDGGTTWQRTAANFTIATVAYGSYEQSTLVLEAGDVIGLNCSQAGLNATGLAQVFFNTAKIRQIYFTAFAAADNTVYTVPAGKTALLVQGTAGPFGQNGPQMFVANGTVGSVTYQFKIKRGAAAAFLMGAAQVLTTLTAASIPGGAINLLLNAGDSIIANSNSAVAGQVMYGVVYEF